MKKVLARMEKHAAECTSVVNHPRVKRSRCERCSRWQQLQKLRDRFMRQLLEASISSRGTRRSSAAGKSPPAKMAAPPLLKRSITSIMDAEEGEMDLSLLPQLVEGEVEGQRRRREAKHGGTGNGGARAEAAEHVAATAATPVRLCGPHTQPPAEPAAPRRVRTALQFFCLASDGHARRRRARSYSITISLAVVFILAKGLAALGIIGDN